MRGGKPKRMSVNEADMLLERIRNGDTKAFEQLYDRYSRLVFGIALRMLGDTASAEDVLQSLFFMLWTSPHRYRGGNFRAWLCRVARNRALDILRQRSAHVSAELTEDLVLDHATEDSLNHHLDRACVQAALAQLPAEQRVPIELGFFEGIPHEEIARRIATPLGTVKTRIRSGLHRLRKFLTPEVAP